MIRKELESLGEARVLKVSRNLSGNILLLVGEGKDTKVLKLYRGRRGRAKEVLSAVSHRIFERKRSTTPRARYRTERLTLDIWEQQGLDVFKRFDDPLPKRFSPPGLWFEYCHGDTLAELVKGANMPLEEKQKLLKRLGALLAERHRLALQTNEPFLAHERGTLNHIFVSGERLITFDFEGGFMSGFPVLEALAQEMAGYVRSVWRRAEAIYGELIRALIEGYGDMDQLDRIAGWGVHNDSYYRRVRRWYDQRQRGDNTKTDSLRSLLSLMPDSHVARRVEG